MENDAGVRFELKRDKVEDGVVHYAVNLEAGERRYTGVAKLGADTGAVEFSWAEGGAPPDWCSKAVHTQLRILFRDGAPGKVFPRRVTRWRPAPPRAQE